MLFLLIQPEELEKIPMVIVQLGNTQEQKMRLFRLPYTKTAMARVVCLPGQAEQHKKLQYLLAPVGKTLPIKQVKKQGKCILVGLVFSVAMEATIQLCLVKI